MWILLNLICQLTSEDIKQHYLPTWSWGSEFRRCHSRGGRTGLPVLMSLMASFCGRKATLNHAYALVTVCPASVTCQPDWHPRTLSSASSSSSSWSWDHTEQDGLSGCRVVSSTSTVVPDVVCRRSCSSAVKGLQNQLNLHTSLNKDLVWRSIQTRLK